MPKKGSKKKPKAERQEFITINGPWGTRLQIPQPRLPRTIGSNSKLSSSLSVYPVVNLDIPFTPGITPISLGNMATVVALNTGQVQNWSTRFASLFNEYCIVGARLELRLNNIANPAGFFVACLDEQSNSLPTGSIFSKPHMERLIDGTEFPSTGIVEWKARDYLDLEWTSTGTIVTPVYLKLYANTTSTGTTSTTSANIYVTGSISFCFRGFAGV